MRNLLDLQISVNAKRLQASAGSTMHELSAQPADARSSKVPNGNTGKAGQVILDSLQARAVRIAIPSV